ncbi:FAD/NAD(P)-binding protein [Rhodococcus sp. NPDC058521]|uniref:FAD/NAD(P)-binding protein n=1 Tax=Rhodococcus sp. NPDC058521 TaxID=3346536 RepID=UPI003652C6C8
MHLGRCLPWHSLHARSRTKGLSHSQVRTEEHPRGGCVRIAVIGSGMAATTAVATLAADGETRLEVYVFDEYGLGSSIAFPSGSNPGVCNTSDAANATCLGLLADTSYRDGAEVFRERRDIGEFLAGSAARLRSHPDIQLHEHLGLAARISQASSGTAVTTVDGVTYDGFARVILARGLSTPHVPQSFSHVLQHTQVWKSPYPLSQCLSELRDRRVLLVGSNLSAIESAIELANVGAAVSLASRHGSPLPSVRKTLPNDLELYSDCIRALEHAQPATPAAMSQFVRSFTADVASPFDIGSGTYRTGVDAYRAELEYAESSKHHWARAIVPICRAINTQPDLAAIGRAAVESRSLRRYTNAITSVTAQRLIGHLAAGRIRHENLRAINVRSSRSGTFDMHCAGGTRRFDAVVLACGWESPRALSGLELFRPVARAEDGWGLGPEVIMLGAEARSRIAVPNALFALADQIDSIRPIFQAASQASGPIPPRPALSGARRAAGRITAP